MESKRHLSPPLSLSLSIKSSRPRHAVSSSQLHPPISFLLLIAAAASSLLFLAPTRCHGRPDPTPTPTPTPTPWPHQFHAALFMNNSGGALQLVDLWYDWPNGRNLNAIRDQLSPSVLHDVEWDNGTSFFYTPGGAGGAGGGSCRTLHFEVGILRPDWLEGASYLGRRRVDGFLCDGWQKADFIWYYEDVATKKPVYWAFFNGMKAHVMTFEAGAALEDAEWQAPAYCFGEKGGEDPAKLAAPSGDSGGYPVNRLGTLRHSMSLRSL